MTGPTELERFWVDAQLDLVDLPRPWVTLERLEQIDPKLHRQLTEGERWLVRHSDIRRLRTGWAQWLRLYRRALAMLNERAGTAAK